MIRIGLSVVVVALVTFYFSPALFSISSVPGAFPDTWVTLWSIWWAEKYLAGLVPEFYFSNLIFAPEGASLLLHNLTESVSLPVAFSGGILAPALRYSLLCWFTFIANFAAAYLLFKKLSLSERLAFFLSLLLTFHPFITGHLAGGHLNLIVWYPFYFYFFGIDLFFKEGYRRGLMIVAFSTAFIAFTDWYQLYFLLLLTGIISVFQIMAFRREGIKKGGLLILTVSAGLLPVFFKLRAAMDLMKSGSYTPNHDPAKHAADIISFLIPGQNQQLGSLEIFRTLLDGISLNYAETGSYIGVSVFLILVFSCRKIKWNSLSLGLCAATVCFMGFSFGLPFVHESLPFVPPVPARFFFPGYVCLFCLFAISVRESSDWAQRGGVFYPLILLSIIEFFPTRMPVIELKGSKEFQELKEDPAVLIVFDKDSPEKAMYHQTLHEKKIIGGFIARRPKKGERLAKRFQRTQKEDQDKFRKLLASYEVDVVSGNSD